MNRLAAPAALLAIVLAACTSGEKSSVSTTSPTPIAATPTPTATRCVPDVMDSAPCPGTSEPVIHQPLPPSGPIADTDVPKHVPVGLSENDRKIVENVMLAQPDDARPYVRWIYCKGKILVFSIAGVPGSFTAAKVLNDDPHSKNPGGKFANIHNCLEFGMPGG
jgi:hypothetical protein